MLLIKVDQPEMLGDQILANIRTFTAFTASSLIRNEFTVRLPQILSILCFNDVDDRFIFKSSPFTIHCAFYALNNTFDTSQSKTLKSVYFTENSINFF